MTINGSNRGHGHIKGRDLNSKIQSILVSGEVMKCRRPINRWKVIMSCHTTVIPNLFINAEPYNIFKYPVKPPPPHIYFYQLKQKIYISYYLFSMGRFLKLTLRKKINTKYYSTYKHTHTHISAMHSIS